MTLYYTYLVVIVISFIASLSVYLEKGSPIYLKVFPLFLLLTFSVEMFARHLGLSGKSNLWLYNIFTAMEFGFYLYFFSAIYREPAAKSAALYAMIIYMVLALTNIFFIQGLNSYHTYTFMLGCVLILAFGAYYFFQLLKVPTSSQGGSLTRIPAFWITAGLMVYYCCDLPVFGILNYMNKMLSRSTTNKLLVVYNFMNIILYSFFTVAFLCRIKIRKYTS